LGLEQHLYPTVIYFGLLPTFFSAITSVISLKTKHDPLAKRAPWVTGLWVLNDLFLALANLAILIPVWISEPAAMGRHGDWMMLETYATVFLMSNMFIHAYLAFYPFKSLFNIEYQKDCPHCHGRLGTPVETVGTKRERYSLLRAENYLYEQEAEASSGTIRLSADSEA
ncbi:cytochrome p450, partial [Paraphaeosphaeria minitans]